MARSLSQIQAEMTKLRIELNGVVEQMEHYKNDYTKEGLAKRYQETVKRQKLDARIAKLRDQVGQWHAGARSASASAIEAAYPTAGDPTEQLSVEMAVQRILSRPGFDDAAAREVIQNMPASPVRTLLSQELAARGMVSSEMQQAMLQANDEEYAQAVTRQQQAEALTHTALGQVEFLESLAGDHTVKPDALQGLDVSSLPGADAAY